MSELTEPTIIEYARFYGLTKDHQTLNPLTLLPAADSGPSVVEEPNESVNIESLQTSLANEKLAISKDAAKLLLFCTTDPAIEACSNKELLGVRQSAHKEKVEVPILLTDHELDVQRFGQRIEPDLAGFNLPYERIDEKHDEGFTWPDHYYLRHEEVDSTCIGEKIEATRDVFVYLQDTLKDSYTDEDAKALIQSELRHNKNGLLDPVTPPLLPASPQILPFIPSSPTCNLDLLSDHTSPTAVQAAEIEDMLIKEDAIKPSRNTTSIDGQSSQTIASEEMDIGQVYSPLKDIGVPPSSLWPKHVRLDDRKVEGPLTPPMTVENPMTKGKNVSFKEMLQEVIPDFPPLIEDPSETSLQDIDTFFEETIAPIADRVNREVEQEQLQEGDSTMRVTVPIMDFSFPVPPWKVYSRGAGAGASDGGSELDAQKRLMVEMEEKHLKDTRWPGAASLDLKLRWSPFPKELGQIATQESIDDDGSLEAFLAGLDITGTVDIRALTWKREGLRVLDDDEDSEEELQPGVFSEGKTIQALIKKRKLEIQESLEMVPTENLRGGTTSQRLQPTKRAQLRPDDHHPHRPQTNLPRPSEVTHGPPLLEGAFSTFGALSNFMDVRGEGTKKQKLTASPFFATPFSRTHSIHPPPAKTAAPTQPQPIDIPLKTNLPPNPLPTLTPLSPSHTFITSSSSLSSHRRIIRRLHHLHPTATFIERDFRPPPTKPHLAPRAHPTDEADLILSSSTGLLWTTLQAIKQRPLPGQSSTPRLPLIRERIARVADRYERLVVLVSEGRDTSSNAGANGIYRGGIVHPDAAGPATALSAKDCDALVELTAFCTGIDADVSVMYVAGGEEELARWIAGVMGWYGVDGGGGGGGRGAGSEPAKLLQEETSWEIFLRRAGLNAFAAQEVLMGLKPPADGDVGEGGSVVGGDGGVGFGLVAFVRMGAEERIRRFEHLLGGRRVLGRVSERLDVVWG